MEWLWWTLGGVCGGLFVLGVIGIVIIVILDNKKTSRVMKEGDHTTGWLVQANTKLFKDGIMDEAGVVVISPDRETALDRHYMMDLAERVFNLKGHDPDDCADEDDAYVAALMADEAYVEGKKDLLPEGFTGGRKVYLAHIMIYRDHLPGKKLSGKRVPCSVVWGDDKLPICSRPLSAKDYRTTKKDEDDY
jgi:hypothetical protein